jgi:hypothetical protein
MRFRFGGLTIDSEIAYPDLPAATGPPGIVIRLGRVDRDRGSLLQEWPDAVGRRWLAIFDAGAVYRVSLGPLDCAIARDGRAITVDAPASLAQPALAHLVLQQVLPLAVSRTGRLVMHACAVEIDSGAVAFVGETGAGKSTLAAAFCRRGHALVADDALVIDAAGDRVWVEPTADALRLWPDHRDVAAGAEITPSASGKLRARVALAADRLPLGRIYLLGTADDGRSSVTLVPTAEMRVAMLSHLFRLDVSDREESRRTFEAVHHVVDVVPVRRAMYPNGSEHLDAAVDAILRDSI